MAKNAVKKVFNDSVHGHIEMHPILVKIIDTPQFQRLRNIKQLGGGYYVFPGASHNRFEHSIGVAHLAGKLVQSLRARQKDLGITDKDELCVQIAGLCHDLGHGPFSHTFENFMRYQHQEKRVPKWEHEEMSLIMFEQLITEYCIKKTLVREYEFNDDDFQFIKQLITKPKSSDPQGRSDERLQKKPFLYQIVANPTTGIDVDKMDYFIRDCHHLGMQCNFSYERYMMFARVCTDENGAKQICMREKEAINMYELFHVRSLLHHKVYQHRVIKAAELMIVDALSVAEDTLKISDKVKKCKMFTDFTDEILQQILDDSKKCPEKAKEIVRRIFEHDFYTFIGEKIFIPEQVKGLEDHETRKEKLKDWLKKVKPNLSAEDFEVVLIKLNYGMKNKNPVDALQFYRKDDPDKAKPLSKDEVSYLLPHVFEETKVLVFYKGKEKEVETLAKENIEKFWKDVTGDPITAAVEDPNTYVHLTDGVLKVILGSTTVEQATAQEATAKISKLGLSLAGQRSFKKNKLKHLDNDKKWKEKLRVWVTTFQKENGDQQPTFAAEDFKVVSYVQPGQSDNTNVMLFSNKPFNKDISKFWDEVQKEKIIKN